MASAKIVVEQVNPNLVTEVFEYKLVVGNAPGAKGQDAPTSGTTALGLITTAATINATTNTEYTGNITADVTLNLEGFTVARPTVKVMLDLVTATTALTITIAGYAFLWPPNQTQTLTDLADGSYSILFSWNATTSKVTVRVQQVA